MLIEDYDALLTLRSPLSRASSSTSLTEQFSPDLISDVKIYHRMSPPGSSPRRHHRHQRQIAADTSADTVTDATRY